MSEEPEAYSVCPVYDLAQLYPLKTWTTSEDGLQGLFGGMTP